MDRYSARSGEIPLSFTLTFFAKICGKQRDQPINVLAGIIKRAASTSAKSSRTRRAEACRAPSRCAENALSQMDLFTAVAIAIVVVLIIAIVVMSGWLR